MNRTQEVLELARQHGIIRAADLEDAGISRNFLYQLKQQGLLEKRGRGIYALPDSAHSEHVLLAEVAKRVPRSVVCLISALSFHGMTTQIPHEIWIAVPRASWRPRIDYPPLNLTYLSGDAWSYGVQSHDLDGVIVKVYSPAKTVADCFKFRNKVGLDVAIEALRECWRAKRATMDELTTAAQVNRVTAVMRPYLEATV
ncbi:MAG: AbiEi antitoxin N-terminal domain-containing protein [Bacteroidetes bacterium]|nr:AbiEi antitoxin N-terminal domain-containing protein [Bacteroidota bacterium]